MKSLKYFAFFIIFPFVMYLFSLLTVTSVGPDTPLAMNPEDFVWSLAINITVGAILGMLGGVALSIFVNVDLLKLFMFDLYMSIIAAFCMSTIDNFAVLGGQNPMAEGIFWIIKIIVSIVVLIAGFSILIGGDWEVD